MPPRRSLRRRRPKPPRSAAESSRRLASDRLDPTCRTLCVRARSKSEYRSRNGGRAVRLCTVLRRVLPTSRDARRILVGTLLSAVGRGLTLPYLFVYLTEVRGISAGTVGLLVGWMGAVSLVLAPLGGSLVVRLGARRVVLPLFVVAALGTASLAFVTGPASAFVSLTLVALAFSAIWAAQTTILASLVDES